jgi:hypothetical protein
MRLRWNALAVINRPSEFPRCCHFGGFITIKQPQSFPDEDPDLDGQAQDGLLADPPHDARPKNRDDDASLPSSVALV